MAEDKDGKPLSATWGGNIYRYESGKWNLLNGSMSVDYVWALYVDASGNIFAGTDDGIYFSSDNGGAWSQSGLAGYDVRAIEANSKDVFFAGTWGGGVFSSSNSGKDWTDLSANMQNLSVTSLVINNSDEIFASTFGGGILKSADDGVTWAQLDISYRHIWSLAINHKQNETIFAGTYGTGMYRSTDDGDTWERVNKGMFSQYIYSIVFDSDGYIYPMSWMGGVYKSTDNGDEWNLLGLNGFGASSAVITATGGNGKATAGDILYVGTSEGKIFTTDITVTGIADPENLPNEFNLYQNYPNPFNPSTTIKFDVQKTGRYKIEIFNILGQRISILADEVMKAGSHQVRFDAKGLSSGAYIYKFSGDDISFVKKMILLK